MGLLWSKKTRDILRCIRGNIGILPLSVFHCTGAGPVMGAMWTTAPEYLSSSYRVGFGVSDLASYSVSLQ